ncbi:MAG: hypothetical protein WDO13_13715 [Verrucomicrobiota bacterium]
MNLNGGTLAVGTFSTSGTQVATFNFNGGTLQATANNSTNFLQISGPRAESATARPTCRAAAQSLTPRASTSRSPRPSWLHRAPPAA